MKVKLTPTITYKILALVDTGCTKNIMHDKYFVRCPEIVHTIDQEKADISTDMSGIKKLQNQLAYNIEVQINNTKYIIDEIMKVIGCSSLREGGGELGTNKNFDLWLQLVCTKLKLKHAI